MTNRASSRLHGSEPPVTAARACATSRESRATSAGSAAPDRTTDRCVAGALVQLDELVGLGGPEPAPAQQLLEPLPLRGVHGGEGVEVHGVRLRPRARPAAPVP